MIRLADALRGGIRGKDSKTAKHKVPIFSIALGALLLVLGVCDVCKRKITWGYSSRMKPKEREIWQRWVGVLELILAVCEFSYVFLTKMQRATSFLFAVLVLSSVCILGPYYHWKHEHKDDPDNQ